MTNRSRIYSSFFTIPEDVIDENGRVNNVAYVQWMHAESALLWNIIRRVRSLRKYEFIRKSDGKLLVKGEMDWVFVDSKTGRPLPIPEKVSLVFNIRSE
jgi:acyl-CoA thioester hydrolase